MFSYTGEKVIDQCGLTGTDIDNGCRATSSRLFYERKRSFKVRTVPADCVRGFLCVDLFPISLRIHCGHAPTLDDDTRLCAMRAGDRSVLLLFKKVATDDTDASGAIQIAFGIARSDLPAWEGWFAKQGISIEFRKTCKYGGEAFYFRDPDGHLLEVVTPGVWSIY